LYYYYGHNICDLYFGDGTTHDVIFRDSGNVGIGDTSPSVPLHITRDTDSTVLELLRLENAGSGGGVGTKISFHDSSVEYGRIQTWYESGWKMQLGGGSDLDTLTLFNGDCGIGVSTPSATLHVQAGTYAATGMNAAERFEVRTTSNEIAFGAASTNSSYTSRLGQWGVAKAGNSDFQYVVTFNGSSSDMAGNAAHNLRGDGAVLADGSYDSGGADYAEYFEVALAEHTGSGIPVGTTVALSGSKVIPASQSDSEVIGVIRPNQASAAIGNTAGLAWHGKFLQDEYGGRILDEDGSQQLNPSYVSQPYTPRENRNEWVIVGLLGQIPITKGQPTGSSWIKMGDVSDTVEMWFVK